MWSSSTTTAPPTASKHFIFYNPPVINRELGIRRSSMLEAKRIAESFIRNEIQTILFTRSRLNVEVLVTYLRNIYGGKSEGEKKSKGLQRRLSAHSPP